MLSQVAVASQCFRHSTTSSAFAGCSGSGHRQALPLTPSCPAFPPAQHHTSDSGLLRSPRWCCAALARHITPTCPPALSNGMSSGFVQWLACFLPLCSPTSEVPLGPLQRWLKCFLEQSCCVLLVHVGFALSALGRKRSSFVLARASASEACVILERHVAEERESMLCIGIACRPMVAICTCWSIC